MTQSDKPIERWRLEMKPAQFHQLIPQWHIVARATFVLAPDYIEGVFLSGANVREASLSLTGYGAVQFLRPLSSPFLRAYMATFPVPIQFLEITQYGATYKLARWPLDERRTAEIIFECQQM
jgi:hypothetical protein